MSNETETAVPTEQSEAVTQSTSIFDELEEQEQSSTETSEVEETAEVEAEAEGATEEADDPNWLPDTQLKEFPAEVIAKYAKRYGYTDEEIAADPRLARFLKDKINSDIEIAHRKKAEEDAAAEEDTEQVVEAVEPTPEEAAKAWTQLEAQLNGFVDQHTDIKVAVAFTDRLAKADAIKDPQERAVAVTKALSFGVLNLLRDALPAFLDGPNGILEQRIGSFIEQRLPGLSESHLQTSRAQTVESIAASNPKYAALGLKFGTAEWQAAAEKAAKILPGMEKVPLPFETKVNMMFSLLTNAPGAVATATAAIEKGKETERNSRQRKTAATLGAGQSKGLAAKATGNDDLFGAPGEIAISSRLVGKQS